MLNHQFVWQRRLHQDFLQFVSRCVMQFDDYTDTPSVFNVMLIVFTGGHGDMFVCCPPPLTHTHTHTPRPSVTGRHMLSSLWRGSVLRSVSWQRLPAARSVFTTTELVSDVTEERQRFQRATEEQQTPSMCWWGMRVLLYQLKMKMFHVAPPQCHLSIHISCVSSVLGGNYLNPY